MDPHGAGWQVCAVVDFCNPAATRAHDQDMSQPNRRPAPSSECAPQADPRGAGARRHTMRAAVRSVVGRVRSNNEDCAHADVDRGLFMVADGIASLAAGEVASSIAVEIVRQTLNDTWPAGAGAGGERRRDHAIASTLGDAVRAAHHAVLQVASCEADKLGMGTTLDLVLVVDDRAFVAHVGDTRTYLVRDRHSAQLTRDHTLDGLLEGVGDDLGLGSPTRSLLMNAIGMPSQLAVVLTPVPVRTGDLLVLCSDGLYDYVSADELAQRLSWDDPDLGAREVVDLALDRGGRDNITVVVVHIDGPAVAPSWPERGQP